MIEVLSTSNGAAELAHLRRECLADKCEQFWIVHPFDRIVEVFRNNGSRREFQQHDTMPFHFEGFYVQMQVGAPEQTR